MQYLLSRERFPVGLVEFADVDECAFAELRDLDAALGGDLIKVHNQYLDCLKVDGILHHGPI